MENFRSVLCISEMNNSMHTTCICLVKNVQHDPESIEILRFYKPLNEQYEAGKNYYHDVSNKIKGLESLLHHISVEDFGVDENEVKIIYSGNNKFPFDEREQWTDACNLLALKDGVVVGYDRNEETFKGFEKNGFTVITAKTLFKKFENKELTPSDVDNSAHGNNIKVFSTSEGVNSLFSNFLKSVFAVITVKPFFSKPLNVSSFLS